MKHRLKIPILFLWSAIFFLACEKEVSNCGPGKINLPPNANAGDDQKFLLPITSATLYGSFSSDPEGDIVSYLWTKVAGPASYTIDDSTDDKTVVKDLVQGTYQFELKVYDECGLYSTDMVEINVDEPTGVGRLIFIGNLSLGRDGILAASVGNKILFIGGRVVINNAFYDSTEMTWWNTEFISTRVDIYNVVNNSWSETDLKGSAYTKGSKATAVGNKLYLTNGYDQSNKMDVYDAALNSWTSMELPEIRNDMAVVSVGSKIFFAGGNTLTAGPSARVDIYNISTATWSIASLSEARGFLSGTVVGNTILFGGGSTGSSATRTVDIFEATSNTWSKSFLNQAREYPDAFTLGTKAVFSSLNHDGGFASMDIYDIGSKSWSTVIFPFGFSIDNWVTSGQKVLFIDYRLVNVYDISRNTFSIIHLDEQLNVQSVVSVNNQVYITGGNQVDFNHPQSKQVWRLQY